MATMTDIVRRMADSMTHRGPDDAGVWVDPSGICALSQRRLSILDLSPAGHQPMIWPETGDAISFNGEIYNYLEIKASLEAAGVVFKGSSDTEALLAALAREGTAALNKLDGMFAFGFWRAKERQLILARDIFGEKPLYYAQTKDFFAFASELQALRNVPELILEPDRHRIEVYLGLRYLPAPLSIYKQVSKLPPASALTLSSDGSIVIESYYRFTASSAQTSGRALDDLADELEALLEETVRSRLLTADVPVGAFLSSGVDSSLIVALAMKQANRPVKTFSIGFPDDPESEHMDAEAMARHLGCDHRTEILFSDFFDMRERIPEMQDEPMGDSSCLPTWAVSRAARREVTVALSGDGGDELFGGYERYSRALREGRNEKFADLYASRMMVFSDWRLGTIMGDLTEETKALWRRLRMPLRDDSRPLLARMRAYDIETYLPDDILAKVDRMSMLHALEVRSPLLGRKVADFAARMASDDLCAEGQSKRVLKRVAARYIPHAWLERKKKGFSIPKEGVWSADKLAQETKALLLAPESKLALWIEPEKLKAYLDYITQTPRTAHIWSVFVLEKWLRRHA